MPKTVVESTLTLHGATLKAIRLSDANQSDIVDLQLELDEAQYARLVTHFDNQQRRWETSCYTYIFQNELAAFEKKCIKEPHYAELGIGEYVKELRNQSLWYADLEPMVNNPPKGNDPLYVLITHLEALKGNKTLTVSMQSKISDFKDAAQKLKDSSPTAREIRQFFSIQKEDPNQPCLGRFIAEQLYLLSAHGMQQVYTLTDKNKSHKPLNRFKQMFAMHPLIKHLSDAQANIEKKGLSIYGARYNNSRDPVPQSMLDTLTSNNRPDVNKKWTSILPYLERTDDLEEIDALIQFMQHTPHTKKSDQMGASVLVFMANIVELALLSTTRLGLAIAAGVTHLCLNLSINLIFKPVSWVVSVFNSNWGRGISQAGEWLKEKLNNGFVWFDTLLGRAYRAGSPIIFAKHYKNSKLEVEDDLKNHLNTPQSYYDQLLSYLSSSTLVKAVNSGITSFFRTLASIPTTLGSGMYLAGRFIAIPLIINPAKRLANLFREKNNQLEVVSYRQRLENERETVFTRYHQKMTAAMIASLEQRITDASAIIPQTNTLVRETVEPWEMSQISSPLDFIDEIFVGLSDIVISPMFRKSPGLATFFFLMANASFTALMVPAFTSAVSSSAYTTWLKGLPKVLSEGFMGKHAGAHESMINKLFATFLQWKLTFFTAEGIMEVSHGDMDFLKDIFHEPEKITLGMSVMIAMGWAMHYLPEIHADIKIPLHKMQLGKNLYLTNYYLEALNIFSHEAKEVTEYGLPPLTGLEYAFLSLKSVFLIENMASGNHQSIDSDLKKFLEKKGNTHPIRDILAKLRASHSGQTLGQALDETLVKQAILGYCTDNSIEISNTLLGKTSAFFMRNAAEIIPLAQQAEQSQSLVATAAPAPKSEVEIAKDSLLQAISTVQKMELLGETFETKHEAMQFYDCLYYRFKAYNYAQRDAGNCDLQLDKEQFLHAFYNKHIYQGSNNLLRMISIFPFLPLTWAWRGLQSLNKSPAIQYKLKKSFAKDGVVLTQFFGAIPGRTGTATVLAYTYGALALIPLTPTYIIGTISNGIERSVRWIFNLSPTDTEPSYSERAMNTVIDVVSGYGFALYDNLNVERPQAFYGRQARVADSNSHSLKQTGAKLVQQLNTHGTSPLSGMLIKYKTDFRDKSLFNRSARQAEKTALERKVSVSR